MKLFDLKYLVSFLLLCIQLIVVPSGYSAQLVDKIPSNLVGSWNVCIDYLKMNTECFVQPSPAITKNLAGEVKQFIYRKEFIISSDLQASTLGIWLNVVDDADEVRINGRLVGKTGHFPPQFESGFRYKRLYLIPSVYLKYNQFNQLEIKTFSSVNLPGLSEKPVVLDDFFKMSHYQQEMDYTYVICIVALLILSLIQVFNYFLVKSSNETIFLSMSLIAFAFISFIRSDAPLHIGLNLSSVFKVEMFVLSFATISLSLFALRFFELRFRLRHIIASSFIAIIGMLSILYPNPINARYVSEVGYFIIAINTGFMLVGTIIFSFLKNRKYVSQMAALFTIIILALAYDTISQAKALVTLSLPILPFILPLMVTLASIVITLIITHRYWQNFRGATYDHLTQTLLRPAFFQRLTDEMNRSQAYKLDLLFAIINIEELKNIGASYGQLTSDKMLKAVSKNITQLLDSADLICLFNEDEFCIAAQVESAKHAENHLRNIHRVLANTQLVVNEDTEIYISSKIAGILYNPDQHLSISQLLQDANYGLAKLQSESNKNYVLLDQVTLSH
jgi:diguanylate cyclase (GGDEF)-like protein